MGTASAQTMGTPKRKEMNRMSDFETRDCGCGETRHIQGISCDVRNCTYHDGQHYCTAGQISVGPAHAEHSGDTACVTFRPKAE